jgi:hypothetical protein
MLPLFIYKLEMGGCCLERCHIFTADTELEGGSKEERRLEEGDRGGHGPKTGRSAIEEEQIRNMFLIS